jgi:hypothetical protein
MWSGAITSIAIASAGGIGDSTARDPPMRAGHPDLSLHPRTLANQGREVVEDLRQIAACLTLRQHRRDEEPRIEERNAPRKRLECVGSGIEVLLVVQQPELTARGIGTSSPTIDIPVVNA